MIDCSARSRPERDRSAVRLTYAISQDISWIIEKLGNGREQDWGTLLHLRKEVCSNNVHARLMNGRGQQMVLSMVLSGSRLMSKTIMDLPG